MSNSRFLGQELGFGWSNKMVGAKLNSSYQVDIINVVVQNVVSNLQPGHDLIGIRQK